eukprot:m.117114 g.117114  ORF g.117114 m.117114 type:complete len:376 (-) comp28555_c0_seq1:123-1250(-)
MKAVFQLTIVLLGLLIQVSGKSSDTWVVIVSTSRFWYNYRHESNALSIYRSVKRLGVPDSNIILMLAEDFACNPRNRYTGTVFNNGQKSINVYGDDIEVDYRGLEVTAEALIRLLTGRHESTVPMSKRLLSTKESNVQLYMTGHGGEDFLKFQDQGIVSGAELGDSFEQMYQQQRYKELLFIIDTCHAESLLDGIHSPNVIGIASSSRHEDSYSVDLSRDIGVHMVDAFTGRLLQFLETVSPDNRASLVDMFAFANKQHLILSHPVLRHKLDRKISDVLVTDFFGNRRPFHIEDEAQNRTRSLVVDRTVGDNANVVLWFQNVAEPCTTTTPTTPKTMDDGPQLHHTVRPLKFQPLLVWGVVGTFITMCTFMLFEC